MQQGQVFQLKMRAVDGSAVWAYRYRVLVLKTTHARAAIGVSDSI